MICFMDRTFCCSPNCTNECGRKMTDRELKHYERLNQPDRYDGLLPISYGYFCGGPENVSRTENIDEEVNKAGEKVMEKYKDAIDNLADM